MSQQEFEYEGPRESRYQGAGRGEEARPKDEPPGAYGAPSEQYEQDHYEAYEERPARQEWRAEQAQAPWWARPQPQQFRRHDWLVVVIWLLVICALLGGLGLVGAIIGALLHIIGIILGVIFAFFVLFLILVLLAVFMIRRAITRAIGPDLSTRHDRHLADNEARRQAHRAAHRAQREAHRLANEARRHAHRAANEARRNAGF